MVGRCKPLSARDRPISRDNVASQQVGVRPLICRLNPLHYNVFYTKDFTVSVTDLSDKDIELSKLCLQVSSANKIAPSN
ncbi:MULTISPECIES: DUF4354 family protein [Serratia]|uniref:DUF4354 family protein n=1 Tax=Serratia fonticola TaxID=47917 RepID=A0AAJ1YBH9_SERFO|nr:MULTISPECIES: DUF4354 family protein [Serratia]MBE0152677.1 DUF4354 family protein [Serratia fonticola]MDQ7207767.1 DUF4354 family protein [Serratia fonticola]MDQ9125074.1 DUF4354 family protein [Serratia fonticola]HBE9078006.1 DUF4354 family protein [Serratia fonticola]HBE9083142.1 DUF4354 family protein [Serratia fonticola]